MQDDYDAFFVIIDTPAKTDALLFRQTISCLKAIGLVG